MSNNNNDNGNDSQKSSINSIIKLNIGGWKYCTSRSTLFSNQPNFFTRLIENDENGRVPCLRDEDGYIFVDRNGRIFEIVLDYLRTGIAYFQESTINSSSSNLTSSNKYSQKEYGNYSGYSKEQIKSEFDFYQIQLSSPNFISQSKWLTKWKKEAQEWAVEINPFVTEYMLVTSEGSHMTEGYLSIVDQIINKHQQWVLTNIVKYLPEEGVVVKDGQYVRFDGGQRQEICSDPLPISAVYTISSDEGNVIQYNYVWWHFAIQYLSGSFNGKVKIELQGEGMI
eukprot:TRINITY_DN2551_c0_g1_i1.p1 TRINITY_DN2551_c0_g1~~TRINITY_DN2551_c0_g1_i1.p1  ORF type:complete len:282 (+),score=43.59 TRINITY_DN2551_c0_g1_i1:158-1003(+)